mmetsp:Transcript_9604/g.30372  ORF Transcript_9604/g.30372 Transcript_9604/m.30372 type:complete len:261 (+) Transcript_9604:12-794(+)
MLLLFRLDAAAVVLPHPDKVATGGEDAWFARGSTFGVFDGVGGWAEQGIDPGLFSRALAVETAREVAGIEGAEAAEEDLARALDTARSRVTAVGTCTACLVHLSASGSLTALNLGDSGFRLLRPSRVSPPHRLAVTLRSREQQHRFNCPFQLGVGSGDSAADGAVYSGVVRAGDLLLLVTDGVTDNLSERQICEALAGPLARGDSARSLAAALAASAHEASLQPGRSSPFAAAAQNAGLSHSGGKPDDVTVLCVRVLDGS